MDEINILAFDLNVEEINVITIITKDKTIKFTGYNSLNHKKNLDKTKCIVESINKALAK